MSTRLQVVMDEAEARELRRLAESEGLTLSEWVRRVLRRAAARRAAPSVERRLAALGRALECGHPTGDIDQLLSEIESGRALR